MSDFNNIPVQLKSQENIQKWLKSEFESAYALTQSELRDWGKKRRKGFKRYILRFLLHLIFIIVVMFTANKFCKYFFERDFINFHNFDYVLWSIYCLVLAILTWIGNEKKYLKQTKTQNPS
ncbi:MAG: hypothetical protein ACRENO_08495 [Thermodesulfobacteriota bacterium]